MDQTGNCLDGKELLIVPKDLVLEVVSDSQKSVPELADYSRELLASAPGPHFLVLLENASDGNFLEFDREVALYEEMVRSHVSLGSTLIIKAHPLSIAPVDEALSRCLASDYVVRRVSDRFRRYPMELWRDLIRACEVMTMSYCSISLTFLYGKSVIYPMIPSLIEKYFPRQFWIRTKTPTACIGGNWPISQSGTAEGSFGEDRYREELLRRGYVWAYHQIKASMPSSWTDAGPISR